MMTDYIFFKFNIKNFLIKGILGSIWWRGDEFIAPQAHLHNLTVLQTDKIPKPSFLSKAALSPFIAPFPNHQALNRAARDGQSLLTVTKACRFFPHPLSCHSFLPFYSWSPVAFNWCASIAHHSESGPYLQPQMFHRLSWTKPMLCPRKSICWSPNSQYDCI